MSSSKSQFETILRHEFRYIRTLKIHILSSIFFCFAPVIIYIGLTVLEMMDMSAGIDALDIVVVLTAFVVPSSTRNLISYSVGGEKAFKTGESLLSTPLAAKTLFLAKCAAPILLSVAMIVVSSSLTLLGMNFAGFYGGAGTIEMYSAEQMILLLPVGIMSSVTMIFVTGALSVVLKTPRKGLYVATLVNILLLIPTALIIYIIKDQLIWSVAFLIALLIVNIAFLYGISGRVRRPWIMNRL